MKKKVTIEKGIVALINANVKIHCPEQWVMLNLKTFRVEIAREIEDKVPLYNNNGGAIGYGIVTRESLLEAADRALTANGFGTDWDAKGSLYVVEGSD